MTKTIKIKRIETGEFRVPGPVDQHLSKANQVRQEERRAYYTDDKDDARDSALIMWIDAGYDDVEVVFC